MTTQRADIVRHNEREFSLAASCGTALFQPRQHGLNPQASLTPDRRGFVCTYCVSESRLFLECVRMGLAYKEQLLVQAGRGPLLMGVRAHVDAEGELRVVYAGIHAPMPFSGGLLLGADYIYGVVLQDRALDVRRNSNHPALEWRELHELIFDAGCLVEAWNCSDAVEDLRRQLVESEHQPGTPAWRTQFANLLSRVFKRDYGA